MSLPRLDRIDRFGHCCVCTRYLITQRIVDGKSVEMFVPEYGNVEFLLNDGSKMGVTICKICQNSYDLNDPDVHKEIMDAVFKGWELETKKLTTEGGETPDGNFIRWSKENGEKYLCFMKKKNIDCKTDTLSKDKLIERSQSLGKDFQNDLIEERNSLKEATSIQEGS